MRHQRQNALQRLPVRRGRSGLRITLEHRARALIQMMRMIVQKSVRAADAGAEINANPRGIDTRKSAYP